MDKLKLFGVLMKAVWELVGWLLSLKKAAPEPIETTLDAKDSAVPSKPKVKVRTAKRTPPSPPESLTK